MVTREGITGIYIFIIYSPIENVQYRPNNITLHINHYPLKKKVKVREWRTCGWLLRYTPSAWSDTVNQTVKEKRWSDGLSKVQVTRNIFNFYINEESKRKHPCFKIRSTSKALGQLIRFLLQFCKSPYTCIYRWFYTLQSIYRRGYQHYILF